MKILLLILVSCTALGVLGEGTTRTTWRDKAVKGGILAVRIAARLNSELASYGISGPEILKAVRKNPKQFLLIVPEHTRKRLIVILPEHEKVISDSIIEENKKNKKIYSDLHAETKLAKIFSKLQKGFPHKLSSRIFLLNELAVNAFCLPDGTVFVTRGAVANLSENQLAAILAHEAGHAFARHGAENITKMLMKSAGEVYAEQKIMESIMQKKHIQGALIKLGYGLGSQLGFMLPYSRRMEFEADKLGMIFLHRAGYDPQVMVELLKFLEAETQNKTWFGEYLSTHPLNSNRIKHAQTVLRELKEK